MSNRLSILISVILAICVGYLAYTFLEYYEEEKDLGWTQAARRNPFLAVQMYSEQKGSEVRSEDSYIKLGSLDSYDTLLLTDTSQILSEKRLQELVAWIEKGGHLIVGVQGASKSDNDRLLSYYEISTSDTDYEPEYFGDEFFDSLSEDDTLADDSSESDGEADREGKKKKEKGERLVDELKRYNAQLKKRGVLASEDEDEKTPRQQMDAYESRVKREQLTLLNFGEDEDEVWAELKASVAIEHPAFIDEPYDSDNYEPIYWRSSDYGVHFLQLETGSGFLTVVSHTDLFESDNIGKFDHAYLWQILTGGGSIAILYGTEMPSLWYMLRAFMPEVLIAFGTFLVMWIWFSIRRFGPVRELKIRESRSSAKHIAASAGYMWRGEWQSELLTPVRAELRLAAEKRVTGYDNASDAKKLELLSNVSGISVDAIDAAINRNEKLNEEHFQKIVRTLQRIRDSL